MVSDYAIILLPMIYYMSLQAGLFSLLLLAISRLAFKAPASLRHALWVLLLIKLVIPPLPIISNDVNANGLADPIISDQIAILQNKHEPAGPTFDSNPIERSVAEGPENRDPGDRGLTFAGVILIAWLVGVCCYTGRLLLRIARQARLLRDSIEAPTELTDMLREYSISHDVSMRLSDEAACPMLLGFWRPVILLPMNIAEICSNDDLKAMLAHELAHVERRDVLVTWLLQIVEVLFFFHPCVWIASREIRKERELACDERVLSRPFIARKHYAKGYLTALKLVNAGQPAIAGMGMAGSYASERRRLEKILLHAIPKFSRDWILVVATLAVFCLPTFSCIIRGTPECARMARILTRQLIPTLEVRYTSTSEGPGGGGRQDGSTVDVHYVRTLEAMYFEQRGPGAAIEQASLDRASGEPRHLKGTLEHTGGRLAKPLRGESGITYYPPLTLSTQHLLDTAGFPLPRDLTGQFLLVDWLQVGHVVRRGEIIDGHACVLVEASCYLRNCVTGYRMWLDPKIGLCPRRVQILWEGPGNPPTTINFRAYRMLGKNYSFPMEQTIETEVPNGGSLNRVTNRVTSIRVGTPIPKKSLIVAFPKGAIVGDF